MRYGHQPYSEIERLPVSRVYEIVDGLMNMIEAENERGQNEH